MTEKISRLKLGFALLVLGLILVFAKPRELVDLSNYTFESEPVEIKGLSAQEADATRIPTRILIPELSIDLEVKKSRIVNGYWEVFAGSAGWGEGSGLPGEVGNQVIFAHAQKGLFLPLADIKKETVIYVLTDKNWYSYKISEIKEVFPYQAEVVAQTEDETLTIYTCSGFADMRRLIVVAKRS